MIGATCGYESAGQTRQSSQCISTLVPKLASLTLEVRSSNRLKSSDLRVSSVILCLSMPMIKLFRTFKSLLGLKALRIGHYEGTQLSRSESH